MPSQRIESVSVSPFDLFSLKSSSKPPEPEISSHNGEMIKPQLSPNPLLRYLTVNNEMITVAEKMTEFNIGEVEGERKELEALRAKQIERLHESLKAEDYSGFWGVLSKIGSMVLGAISTIVGAFFLTSGAGTIVGGAMIASGVLSIANLTLEETGGWDWIVDKLAKEDEEFRKTLRLLLPAGIGAICGITGLGSAFFGWESLNSLGKLITVAQTAANFIAGATTAAQGVFSAKTSIAQAEHLELSREVYEKEECLDELINRFLMCQRQIRKELDSASRIITLQSRN